MTPDTAPSTWHPSAPALHPHGTHTTTEAKPGLCSHSGFRTAGPCSLGNRCSPCTWLDLDLGSDGQASLTRVDGQLQRMRRRPQLPPKPISIGSTVAASLLREEKARAPQTAVHARPARSSPIPLERPQSSRGTASPQHRCAWPCCFPLLPSPPHSPNISQCLFCWDRITLLLLHGHHCCVDLYLWFQERQGAHCQKDMENDAAAHAVVLPE